MGVRGWWDLPSAKWEMTDRMGREYSAIPKGLWQAMMSRDRWRPTE